MRINRLGFVPGSEKLAVVVDPQSTVFSIRDANTDATVFCGQYSEARRWDLSAETVRVADFSTITTPGEYVFHESQSGRTATFEIGENTFANLHFDALRVYYYNRASTALPSQHAGIWQRQAGHPDTNVQVHSSAASASRPAGTVISAPKGWYDAGDYNKYIVNSGISTYTLLAAYEHFPSYYDGLDLNIPESGDGVPDILDEIKWNLDWMEAMQDTDGGVYHKLTTKNFTGEIMPHQGTAQRYVVQKTTAAALDFAAVMAVASRVYAKFEAQFPGKSGQYLQAAERAWQWAQANPRVIYSQPADIQTGAYGDAQVDDEFVWAAAELYLGTGDGAYLARFKSDTTGVTVPWWGGVKALGYLSLAAHSDQLTSGDREFVNSRLLQLADALVAKKNASPYQVAMAANDFVWGSNSGALNQAVMLINAYRINGNEQYRSAATAQLDYILGRNPTGYAFVTGMPGLSPMHVHHRPSKADGIVEPVPGFVAGGPQPGQEDRDHCDFYTTDLPAKSYIDQWCSYATNEVTINWNAPLVYLVAALSSL